MTRELPEIVIQRIDSRGLGRGTFLLPDGSPRKVIVPGTLPGDVVDVVVRRRKAGALHGEVSRLISTDHPRVQPFCRHFSQCGGCTLQDLAYPDQLLLKQLMVERAFAEVEGTLPAVATLAEGGGPAQGDAPAQEGDTPGAGNTPPAGTAPPAGTPLPAILPILPAATTRRYRNKLEFSFGAQRWLQQAEVDNAAEIPDRRGLGFHVAGRFDRVLDLTECHLQPDPSEQIREFLRRWSGEGGLTYYDAREHHGLLRLLIIRTTLGGQAMVTVMFGEDNPAAIEEVMQALAAEFPHLEELNYVVNTTRNDSIFGHEIRPYRGPGYITEHCGPVQLRLRPKAFFQTNPEQALNLYTRALELADLPESPLVFDLYSGIGSIALFLAPRVGTVVGIESVADAVAAARENAQLNGITNALFEEGEVEKVLPEVVARHGTPQALVVDPPRMGLHPAARTAILALDPLPQRIVYISCNPRTQATDLLELRRKYRVTALQPVDMFPQTRHVENIAILELKVDPPTADGVE